MDRKSLTITDILKFLENHKIDKESVTISIKHGESITPVYLDQFSLNIKKEIKVNDINDFNTKYEIILDMENTNWIKQMFVEEDKYDEEHGYGYCEDDTDVDNKNIEREPNLFDGEEYIKYSEEC